MTILCISIGSVVAIDSSIIENNTNLENVSENRLNIISNEGIDDETEVIGSDEVINVEDEVIGSNENVKISEENLNSSFNSSYVENFPECDNDVRFTNDTYKVYFADVETEGDNYFNISFSLNSNNLKTQSVMINSLTNSNFISLDEIINAANVFYDYLLLKKGIPNEITVGNNKYTTEQFLYLIASAINNIYDGKTSVTYVVKSVNSPAKDLNGDWVTSSSISKINYVDLAKRVLNYINTNGRAPNYATLSDGKKANYDLYVSAFAGILTYYKNNKALPSSYVFSNSIFESYSITKLLTDKANEKLTFYLTTDNIINSSTDNAALNTIKNTLLSLGYNVKIIGVGPNMHNIAYKSGCTGSNSVLLCCFGGVDVCPIEEWVGKNPQLGDWFPNAYAGANILAVFYLDPYGCAANLNDYVGMAWDAKTNSYYGEPLDNPAKYMSDNGISYIQTGTVNQVCAILKAMFKGVSNSSTSNNITNSTTTASTTASTIESSFTISQIISSAVSLKSYVLSNKELPSTVTVGSSKISIAKFSYLMGVAIQSLKNGKSLNTKISLLDVSTSKPSGNTISKTISLSSYITVTNNVVSYVKTNKLLPNYATVNGVKAEFKVYTYAFAKILAFYKSNKRLPNTCLFESGVFKSSSSSSSSSISGITYKKGINELVSGSLSAYLTGSGSAAITTAIKDLASSLTKNCKNDLEKANALFTYVRSSISYSYYYNTKYKASGTLTNKKGNCCDKSNLLVALCRASGIAARYCHSTSCNFNSGLNCGHVWAQVAVDGVWYVADTTSSSNTLGHINNWNINSVGTINQYASLPF